MGKKAWAYVCMHVSLSTLSSLFIYRYTGPLTLYWSKTKQYWYKRSCWVTRISLYCYKSYKHAAKLTLSFCSVTVDIGAMASSLLGMLCSAGRHKCDLLHLGWRQAAMVGRRPSVWVPWRMETRSSNQRYSWATRISQAFRPQNRIIMILK